MGILTTSYPELPEFVKSEDCTKIVLAKALYYNQYYLEVAPANKVSTYYVFSSDSDSWIKHSTGVSFPSDCQYIFSTYDIYDNNNNLIAKGMPKSEIIANSQSYATVGNYSSSTFLTALNDTKFVLSIAFALVIACIGFRKGFNWLRGTIKGA